MEVTSSKSLAICKTVMDKLLIDCLKEGLATDGKAAAEGAANSQETGDADQLAEKVEGLSVAAAAAAAGDANSTSLAKRLVIEQVKIFDESGELRVVYPSRVDLDAPHLNVIRS